MNIILRTWRCIVRVIRLVTNEDENPHTEDATTDNDQQKADKYRIAGAIEAFREQYETSDKQRNKHDRQTRKIDRARLKMESIGMVFIAVATGASILTLVFVVKSADATRSAAETAQRQVVDFETTQKASLTVKVDFTNPDDKRELFFDVNNTGQIAGHNAVVCVDLMGVAVRRDTRQFAPMPNGHFRFGGDNRTFQPHEVERVGSVATPDQYDLSSLTDYQGRGLLIVHTSIAFDDGFPNHPRANAADCRQYQRGRWAGCRIFTDYASMKREIPNLPPLNSFTTDVPENCK